MTEDMYAVISMDEFSFPASVTSHADIPACEEVVRMLMARRNEVETERTFDPAGFYTQIHTGTPTSYLIMALGHKIP